MCPPQPRDNDRFKFACPDALEVILAMLKKSAENAVISVQRQRDLNLAQSTSLPSGGGSSSGGIGLSRAESASIARRRRASVAAPLAAQQIRQMSEQSTPPR